MTNRLMIAGIILLVLGLVMIGVGVSALKGVATPIKTFSEQQPGEYVSSEIILNSSSAVVVRSPGSAGGLIPAQDLGSVNSANVGSFALSSKSTAGGSATYINLTGDYYYVVFSSSQPSTSIVVAGDLGHTIVFGLLVLLGFIFVIAGLVMTLVGWRRGKRADSKKKASVSDSDYYANRQDGSQQPPPPPSASS